MGLAELPRSEGVSEMVGGSLMGGLLLLGEVVVTRASEAVEDNVGVACDEETTAGTDIDLMTGLERFREKSTRCGGSGGVDVVGVERGDLATVRRGLGFTGGLSYFFCSASFACGPIFPPCCAAAEAQIAATAVTFPPRPPRADFTSYLTSGSGRGVEIGSRGG